MSPTFNSVCTMTAVSSAEKQDKSDVTETFVVVANSDDARLAELGYKGEFKREFSVSYDVWLASILF